jgi:hypothetical protein
VPRKISNFTLFSIKNRVIFVEGRSIKNFVFSLESVEGKRAFFMAYECEILALFMWTAVHAAGGSRCVLC